MPLNYGPPIYQAYLDAVQGNIKAQEAKMELGLHAIELTQGIINIQNQMQERKAVADAYAQADQQQGPPGQGGAQIDPAEKTARVYDKISQSIGRFNPKLALEYSTKASTLRDQALTRQKNSLEITNQTNDAVGKIFGSVQPGDQEGYTAALQKLPAGIDISKFNLTGNVVQDMPQLKKIAEGTLTYKDKLNAEHQQVTEQQADLNYKEKVRYDSGRLSMESSKINLEAQRVTIDKQFKEDSLAFHARADARAQAGLERTDAMDLSKSKDFAGRQGKQDVPYVQSLIATDPDLAQLGDDQKKGVVQSLALGARAALSKSVTKPGQSVTADDFMREVQKLIPQVKKNMVPGAKGFLGFGAKDAQLKSPLPAAIDTKAQFDELNVGDQFRKDGKMLKKTGPNSYEEIK